MNLKFSIITATMNSSGTIGSALESLAAQTASDIEHIIVDGVSSDDTLNICRANAVSNQVISSEPDTGIYDALNKGIDKASGDIIGFLHSDDVFASSRVLEIVSQAFEETGADLVYGDLRYVSSEDLNQTRRRWVSGRFTRSSLFFGWMPPHPTVFMKRQLIKDERFDASFRISGDYDQLSRILRRDVKVTYIPECLVKMRLGGESNKSIGKLWLKVCEDYAVTKRYSHFWPVTLLSKNVRKIPQFFV